MLSLNERHSNRAQRKADNLAESGTPVFDGMGTAMAAVSAAVAAVGALTSDQRAELADALGDASIFDAERIRSIAEDADGNLSLAGIGAINPALTPGGKIVAEARKGIQKDGELPKPSFDPAEGNAAGVAIAQATAAAGWGSSPAEQGNGGGETPKA